MLAEAAKAEGNESEAADGTKKKAKRVKGTCDKRRGALEVTRAISLTPFTGDITFNAKSGEKSSTSLYGTEVHATRYQYGFALTPEWLREHARVLDVVDAIVSLSEVAGNQSRFLYDFSPDSVVFRWTDDFSPRMLYGFRLEAGGTMGSPEIVRRVKAGDVNAAELVVGGTIVDTEDGKALQVAGAAVYPGIKAAAQEIKQRIRKDLKLG
jgi:CRISPR-associated protein Cst2